jgi:hypothetical protein
MAELLSPLIIESTFRLPGLGLLVLPDTPEPDWLTDYALHTAFAVTLPFSDIQSPLPVVGTIEEISREGQLPRRALLLDFDPGDLLKVGVQLQVGEINPEIQ